MEVGTASQSTPKEGSQGPSLSSDIYLPSIPEKEPDLGPPWGSGISSAEEGQQCLWRLRSLETQKDRYHNFPMHIPMLLRTVPGPWQVTDYYIPGGDVINNVIPQAQNVKWLSQDHTQESRVRAGTHICFLYMMPPLQKSLPQRLSHPSLPWSFFLWDTPCINGPF